jgi:hypothetical protein
MIVHTFFKMNDVLLIFESVTGVLCGIYLFVIGISEASIA